MNKIPNDFKVVEMTRDAALQAAILSPETEAFINNLKTDVAMAILNLVFDGTNPVKFAQEEAHLKGQLAAYRILIAASEDAKEEAMRRARDSQNS